MAKKPKVIFNEIKYQEALETLAEQIVAMVVEDGGDKVDLDNYTSDTLYDLTDRAKELFKKGRK